MFSPAKLLFICTASLHVRGNEYFYAFLFQQKHAESWQCSIYITSDAKMSKLTTAFVDSNQVIVFLIRSEMHILFVEWQNILKTL